MSEHPIAATLPTLEPVGTAMGRLALLVALLLCACGSQPLVGVTVPKAAAPLQGLSRVRAGELDAVLLAETPAWVVLERRALFAWWSREAEQIGLLGQSMSETSTEITHVLSTLDALGLAQGEPRDLLAASLYPTAVCPGWGRLFAEAIASDDPRHQQAPPASSAPLLLVGLRAFLESDAPEVFVAALVEVVGARPIQPPGEGDAYAARVGPLVLALWARPQPTSVALDVGVAIGDGREEELEALVVNLVTVAQGLQPGRPQLVMPTRTEVAHGGLHHLFYGQLVQLAVAAMANPLWPSSPSVEASARVRTVMPMLDKLLSAQPGRAFREHSMSLRPIPPDGWSWTAFAHFDAPDEALASAFTVPMTVAPRRGNAMVVELNGVLTGALDAKSAEIAIPQLSQLDFAAGDQELTVMSSLLTSHFNLGRVIVTLAPLWLPLMTGNGLQPIDALTMLLPSAQEMNADTLKNLVIVMVGHRSQPNAVEKAVSCVASGDPSKAGCDQLVMPARGETMEATHNGETVHYGTTESPWGTIGVVARTEAVARRVLGTPLVRKATLFSLCAGREVFTGVFSSEFPPMTFQLTHYLRADGIGLDLAWVLSPEQAAPGRCPLPRAPE